jgi:SAM-dependent methyltransferase
VSDKNSLWALYESGRRWLKKFPILVSVKTLVDRVLHGQEMSIVTRLPIFATGSGGSWAARAEMTMLAANQTFPVLTHFLKIVCNRSFPVITIEDFNVDPESSVLAAQLKRNFDKYGSDKATINNYHTIYAHILRNVHAVTAVLEIGLGTNNVHIISHMSRSGRPGASLRAVRDLLPEATIYGADVDKRILFQEDRIQTFYVDQTDLDTLEVLSSKVGTDFDLIIDDGLHSPNANIAVLTYALGKLKPGGWFVVEDIPYKALPIWQVVSALLPTRYKPRIISTRSAIMFAVENCP